MLFAVCVCVRERERERESVRVRAWVRIIIRRCINDINYFFKFESIPEFCYESDMRALKSQTTLRFPSVSPEPSLIALKNRVVDTG